MIYNLIKKIYEYKKLKVGDIIIAKRYNNIFDKYKIKKGHRIGPFIIINNNYALHCTTSKKNTIVQIKLHNKYNLDKETYINLKQCRKIKFKQYIKTIDKLDNKDLSVILKECKHQNKKYLI